MGMARAITRDYAEGRENIRIVVGLAPVVKVGIIGGIVMPQLAISCFLLWLGCRWLIATNNFQELVLNAAALEFIYTLKDLIFKTMVSERSKMDMETSEIFPNHVRSV